MFQTTKQYFLFKQHGTPAIHTQIWLGFMDVYPAQVRCIWGSDPIPIIPQGFYAPFPLYC